MKTKTRIIAPIVIGFIIILVGGAALYNASRLPTVAEIRAKPDLFHFDDYPDKIALHTRLSALFPRGTTQQEIGAFFKQIGIIRTASITADCVVTSRYQNGRFIFDKKDRNLIAVQVISDGKLWPEYKPDCTPRQAIVNQTTQNQNPLTPEATNQPPIHLELEPIPGLDD